MDLLWLWPVFPKVFSFFGINSFSFLCIAGLVSLFALACRSMCFCFNFIYSVFFVWLFAKLCLGGCEFRCLYANIRLVVSCAVR